MSPHLPDIYINGVDKVLVVDDDVTARLVAHQALTAEGFSVIEAEDGLQALEVFQDHLPDIILLDVDMPELNGYEACTQLRNLPCGKLVPILMVTGQDDIESVGHAYDVGATDFVTKPLNWKILGHRIRYMLRASAVRNELHELQKSEARLDNAQRIAGLGSWEWNLKTNETYWSEQLYHILGLKRGVGSPTLQAFLNHVPTEDHMKLRRWMVDSIQAGKSGKSSSLNHLLRQSGGKTLSIRHQIEIHVDATTQSCLMFGTVLDVTQLKEAEAKIFNMMSALATSDQNLRNTNRELAQALSEKRHLLHRIISTQENERSYLAQELHDDLGQLLTAVQTEAAVLDAKVGDNENLSASISAIRSCTSAMYNTVYSRIRSLKPLELSNLGLVAALPEMPIISSLRSMEVDVELDVLDDLPIQDDELETNLYRVAQEALSNVVKHANATKVQISLAMDHYGLQMKIFDNGSGFNDIQSTRRNGYGVLGMQERVEGLGGSFTINSPGNVGCHINIHIPISNMDVLELRSEAT